MTWSALAFYREAFGFTSGRRLGDEAVELLGGPAPLYLLAKAASTATFEGDPSHPMAAFNYLEPSARTALQFIGIGEFHGIAIEHQEKGGERLVDELRTRTPTAQPA